MSKMSFRELQERYYELVELSRQELIERIGPWWAQMFEMSKNEIKQIKEGMKNDR